MNTRAEKTIKNRYYSNIYTALGALALLVLIPVTIYTVKNENLSYSSSAAGECTIQVSAGGSIQAALDTVQPGGVICLALGVYKETITTKRAGTALAPITIRGTDIAKDSARRNKTVLHPGSLCTNTNFTHCRNINIDHSYYRIEGFSIDGQEALKNVTFPTDPSQAIAFKDNNQSNIKDGRNIYIGSSESSRDITGVVITNMYIRGGGGECIRMRNNAFGNEVSNSVIEWCGMFAKPNNGFNYHNGEGVYLGTSPKSTTQPMYANDQTKNNIVKDNIIHTYGSECFNVKENASDNTFLNNECAYNLEPQSNLGSNVELRGHNNTIEGNTISHSASFNIKMKSDEAKYDKGGNKIINNILKNSSGTNVLHEQVSVGTVCGNTLDGASTGIDKAALTKPCTGTTPTTPPTQTPTATVTPPNNTYSLTGTVFFDSNRNGVWDSEQEQGHSGAKIQFLTAAGALEGEKLSNPSYNFTTATAGDYRVTLVVSSLPANTQATTDTSVPFTFSTTNRAQNVSFGFAIIPSPTGIPTPTCTPRPPCMLPGGGQVCVFPTPVGGWCPIPTTTVTPSVTVSPGAPCPKKFIGDANCQSTPAGKAVDILDYAIWYGEFINECKQTNLAACGADSDGNGNAMDANFNYDGTTHMQSDNAVTIFDYAIWIQGLSTGQ